MNQDSMEEEEVNNDSESLLSDLPSYPDGDTFRILLVTDTHLGFKENDDIRCYDSFRAFDEALSIANKYNCDLVLHSGDLFHQNRPSRFCKVKTMNILRKHCLGNKPIHFQIVSDQTRNFQLNGSVNYEDPNFNVSLPLFIIHGNHDDPAGKGQFAALEELASANLLNYYGRQDDLDKIEMFPILMKKGETKVALYGLGYIRDERLHRAFLHHKVKWIRPKKSRKVVSSQSTHVSMESHNSHHNQHSEVQNSNNSNNNNGNDAALSNDWFNIMQIHQNRTQRSTAYKNCIPEEFLPKFLDVVYWGHEHECLIDLQESLSGSYWITQPGSPIATSLSQSEANGKYVGIMEVRRDECRLIPVKLNTTRPFIFDDIVLSDFFESDAPDLDIEQFLIDRVKALISKAAGNDDTSVEMNQNSGNRIKQEGNGRNGMNENDDNKDNSKGVKGVKGIKGVKSELEGKLPLIRLRVEYTGFNKLRASHFGQHFIKQVANPEEILHFYKKKSLRNKKNNGNNDENEIGESNNNGNNLRADFFGFNLEDIEQATPIQEIVANNLRNASDKLSVIAEPDLMDAIETYVEKEDIHVIEEFCSKRLEEMQQKLIESNINIDHIETECKKITQNRRTDVERERQLKLLQQQRQLEQQRRMMPNIANNNNNNNNNNSNNNNNKENVNSQQNSQNNENNANRRQKPRASIASMMSQNSQSMQNNSNSNRRSGRVIGNKRKFDETGINRSNNNSNNNNGNDSGDLHESDDDLDLSDIIMPNQQFGQNKSKPKKKLGMNNSNRNNRNGRNNRGNMNIIKNVNNINDNNSAFESEFAQSQHSQLLIENENDGNEMNMDQSSPKKKRKVNNRNKNVNGSNNNNNNNNNNNGNNINENNDNNDALVLSETDDVFNHLLDGFDTDNDNDSIQNSNKNNNVNAGGGASTKKKKGSNPRRAWGGLRSK